MCADQENGRRGHVISVLKVFTLFICLGGFIANSFIIFTQFIGKKTITSQNTENNDRLLLPSFTICSLSGFKEEMDDYDDLVLKNYLNKTLNLEEILYGYYDDEDLVYLDAMKADTTSWKFTITYSQYKGRCHTLTYKKQVRRCQKIIDILNQMYLYKYILSLIYVRLANFLLIHNNL